MAQNILAIACSKLKLTKQSDNLRMQSMDSCFKCGIFPFLANSVFNFFPGFFQPFLQFLQDEFSVKNELFESNSRYFSPYWIKPGKDNASGVSSIMRSIPVRTPANLPEIEKDIPSLKDVFAGYFKVVVRNCGGTGAEACKRAFPQAL